MSLIEQLPEPFTNNEEKNQGEDVQVNQQINNQVNQQTNQQLDNNIETRSGRRRSNKINNCLLGWAIFLLSLESCFFTLCVFALLLSFALSRYPGENEDKEDKYLGSMFGCGIPCLFLPGIIIAVSKASFRPKTIFITNCILVLIKTGLFIGFLISLCKITGGAVPLIGIIPEIGFDCLFIINDSLKLNNQDNNNQDNNNQNNN